MGWGQITEQLEARDSTMDLILYTGGSNMGHNPRMDVREWRAQWGAR